MTMNIEYKEDDFLGRYIEQLPPRGRGVVCDQLCLHGYSIIKNMAAEFASGNSEAVLTQLSRYAIDDHLKMEVMSSIAMLADMPRHTGSSAASAQPPSGAVESSPIREPETVRLAQPEALTPDPVPSTKTSAKAALSGLVWRGNKEE